MENEGTILFRIESENGDDQVQVPVEEAQAKVDELVKADKFVTIEKKDGTTVVASEKKEDWGGLLKAAKDQLKATTEELKKEEKKVAETPKVNMDDVKSVTATGKLKAG